MSFLLISWTFHLPLQSSLLTALFHWLFSSTDLRFVLTQISQISTLPFWKHLFWPLAEPLLLEICRSHFWPLRNLSHVFLPIIHFMLAPCRGQRSSPPTQESVNSINPKSWIWIRFSLSCYPSAITTNRSMPSGQADRKIQIQFLVMYICIYWCSVLAVTPLSHVTFGPNHLKGFRYYCPGWVWYSGLQDGRTGHVPRR